MSHELTTSSASIPLISDHHNPVCEIGDAPKPVGLVLGETLINVGTWLASYLPSFLFTNQESQPTSVNYQLTNDIATVLLDFHKEVRNGCNIGLIRYLLAERSDILSLSTVEDAVVIAAEHGHKAVCEVLLEHIEAKRSHIQCYDEFAAIAIAAAAANGHLEVIRLLFDYMQNNKIDIDSVPISNQLFFAAQNAAMSNHSSVINFLLGKNGSEKNLNGSITNAIIGACSEGHVAIIKELVEKYPEQAKPLLKHTKDNHPASIRSHQPLNDYLEEINEAKRPKR